MSNSKNENPPSPVSDSKNSQENSPVPMSVSSINVDKPPTPVSDSENLQENPSIRPRTTASSIDVDEPPAKRARNFTASEIVYQSFYQLRVTGSSLQSPINITGPSPLTPESFSFACSLYAGHLKFAIQGLRDRALNPLALLRIDVDDVSGFNATVQNWGGNDFGHVCLKPSDLECTVPIQGKFISLPELYRRLRTVNDTSLLYIFQFDGCKDLNFYTFGSKPVIAIIIRLLEKIENNDDYEIPKFPERSPACEIAVLPDDFLMMLQYVLQWAPYQVVVEIKENTATLTAGRTDDTWTRDYPMSTGTEAGKRYCARFVWTDDEWLSKAACRNTAFAVSLYTEQPTYFVLKFFIEDLGYVEYMREPDP